MMRVFLLPRDSQYSRSVQPDSNRSGLRRMHFFEGLRPKILLLLLTFKSYRSGRCIDGILRLKVWRDIYILWAIKAAGTSLYYRQGRYIESIKQSKKKLLFYCVHSSYDFGDIQPEKDPIISLIHLNRIRTESNFSKQTIGTESQDINLNYEDASARRF